VKYKKNFSIIFVTNETFKAKLKIHVSYMFTGYKMEYQLRKVNRQDYMEGKAE
jgi:hypothetical protein